MITQIDLTAYYLVASAILGMKLMVFGAFFILRVAKRR